MTMPQGASGLSADAWLAPWVMRPEPTNPVVVTPGPDPNVIGASGASGASGATGAPPFLITTDKLSDLNTRTQDNISALYQDAVPLLSAWEMVADALFNGLMGGFNSIENFLELIIEAIIGDDIEINFLTDGVQALINTIVTVIRPIIKFFIGLWETIGEPIIDGIFGFLGWVWELFDSIVGKPAREILEDVAGFLFRVWGNLGGVFQSILEPALGFLAWLWDLGGDVLEDIAQVILDIWEFGESIVKGALEWIFGLWTDFGQPLIDTVVKFILDVWEQWGEPVIKAITDTLGGIWTTFDQVIIDNIVQFFKDLTDNRNLLDVLEDVANFFWNVIEDFGSIAAGIPLVSTVMGWIVEVIKAITGNIFIDTLIQGLQTVVSWVLQIPVIGPILSAIIPDEWENFGGKPASSMADLKEYSQELINTSSVLNSGNLQGEIPVDVLPVVSPGLVGDTRPNLVSDAGFRSAASVQAGSGWSWDSAVSRTAGDGGSAKVVGDGSVKQMFSNLTAVSPGQEIEVGVYARWTKPTSARPTVSVGLRGYNGAAVVFTQAVDSKASIVQNSSSFSGNVNGWVSLLGTYQIPASVQLTHVRLVLSVLNAPNGTSVWFDEAAMRKVSLIGQELVSGASPGSNLADDIENSVGVDSYQALLDRVAKKTGASLADVQATVDDFLDGDSTISGDQIKAGNIASAYINELRGTWDKVKTGIEGPTVTADGTLDSAFAALDGWRSTIAASTSAVLVATGSANNALTRVNRLETDFTTLRSYVQKMADDIRAVAIKNGITPTTPATPPGETPTNFREASDNFDRTSLGSAWTTGVKFSNAGVFKLDGNNAFFEAPAVTIVDAVGAVIHAGQGSATNFQRVYVSLGSAPGRPLVGTSGYIDLIGRAVDPTRCVVARFYANRNVRLFFRSGAWESSPQNPSNVFGSFSLPQGTSLTSGTMLEFFIGNKSNSDRTACFVRVGSSWVSGTHSISSTTLATMGNRWGWGGGNGLSGAVAQQSAYVNFWGAQDQ